MAEVKSVAVMKRVSSRCLRIDVFAVDSELEMVLASAKEVKRTVLVEDVGKHAIRQDASFFGYELQIAGIRGSYRDVVLCEDTSLTFLSAGKVDKH